MKLASFVRGNGVASWGIVVGDQVVDCGGQAPSLKVALAGGVNPQNSGRRFPLSEVTLLPPIPDPEKIICVGLNYLTHIQEGGRDVPKFPTVFTRWANTQVAHGQDLVRPRQSETLDFEGELAVVVGQRARHVPAAEAMALRRRLQLLQRRLRARMAAPHQPVHARQELPRTPAASGPGS